MDKLITKIWLFILAVVLISFSLFISFFLFIAVLAIILVTVPYFMYIRYRAKKEFDRHYREVYKIKKELSERSD
ncbi:hypothetical protein [Persephonella sp.]